MEPRTKQNLLVTAFGIILFAVLMNLSTVLGFIGGIFTLILPIIAGSIVALFISVPVNGIQGVLEKQFEKRKKRISGKKVTILSFIVTLIMIIGVFAAVLILLIPELIHSSTSLYEQIEADLPEWISYLRMKWNNDQWMRELLANIDADQLMHNFTNWMNTLVPNVVNVLTATVNVVITAAFAVIISIYMILGKENVSRHTRKLVCAYLKPEWSEGILRFSHEFYRSFSQFLSGQCTEAVILGILMFITFTIFHLPYGSLVGVLTAVCAIIPYVGAFISCAVSIFLTLIYDPTLVIRCTVVYLATQFIENQFIYPRVVGKSVGLPPFYTLIAALIGGKLFGILGIIFFIPLMAVLIEFVKEDANRRLKERKDTR